MAICFYIHLKPINDDKNDSYTRTRLISSLINVFISFQSGLKLHCGRGEGG